MTEQRIKDIVLSVDRLQCRLCFSENIKIIFRLQNKGKEYTVIACRECDVLQTVEHYDAISPDYIDLSDEKIDDGRIWCQGEHKLPAFHQWLAQVNRLSQDLEKPLQLLDIGCGTGGFLYYARDHGFDVYGFDSSQAQIDYAQRELPNVRKAFSPTEYLALLRSPDFLFDIITAWDVLEHVRRPLEFLQSIRAVLKPNGLLFISIPNARAMLWKRFIYSIFGNPNDNDWVPWEHVFYYSTKSLKTYLNHSGFQVLEIGSVNCYPRPFSFFELIRRMGFKITSFFPSFAPQIFVWARLEENSENPDDS